MNAFCMWNKQSELYTARLAKSDDRAGTMVTYRDLSVKIQELKIPAGSPVIVHASLSAFGTVRGGAETILGALFSVTDRILFPAFTYKTMVIPEDGPENNGLKYGSGHDTNLMAEFFSLDMPVDPLIGQVAEVFRTMPLVRRSNHPLLSFCGIHLDEVLRSQTIEDPLMPLQDLSEMEGWVILLGVDHTSNTTIHLAEKQASQHDFTRWALTPAGICACPGFPGCSQGFNKIAPVITDISHHAQLGKVHLQSMPIQFLVDIARDMVISNPVALLCDRPDCLQCNAVRNAWGT